MTRHSLLFHILRGVLVGAAGGLVLGLALVFVLTAKASAQTDNCHTHECLAGVPQERCGERPGAVELEAGGRMVEPSTSHDRASWTVATLASTGVSCVRAGGKHRLEAKPPAPPGPRV